MLENPLEHLEALLEASDADDMIRFLAKLLMEKQTLDPAVYLALRKRIAIKLITLIVKE